MVINLIQWCSENSSNRLANAYLVRMDEFYYHLDLVNWDDFLEWNLLQCRM